MSDKFKYVSLLTHENIYTLSSGDHVYFINRPSNIKVNGKIKEVGTGGILYGQWWIDGLEEQAQKVWMGIKYDGPNKIYLSSDCWTKSALIDNNKIIKTSGMVDKFISFLKEKAGQYLSTYWNKLNWKEKILIPMVAFLVPGGTAFAIGLLEGKSENQSFPAQNKAEEELTKHGIDPNQAQPRAAWNYTEAKKKRKKKKHNKEVNKDMTFFEDVGIGPGFFARSAKLNQVQSFYFGTSSKFIPVIEKHGIKNNSIVNMDDWTKTFPDNYCVVLAGSPLMASLYAKSAVEQWGGKPIILKINDVDYSQIKVDEPYSNWKDFIDHYGFVGHNGDIGPKQIKILRQGKTESKSQTMREKLNKQLYTASLFTDYIPEIKPLTKLPYCVVHQKVRNGELNVSAGLKQIFNMSEDAETFFFLLKNLAQ